MGRILCLLFFFQAEDGIRDVAVTGVQTCALPILLRISIQWREIFTLHVVADSLLYKPRLHINLIQLKTEASNGKPIEQEGWQDALQNIYPFKINRFRVQHGDVVYIDTDPKRPLHVENLMIEADNVRNIHAPED